MNLDIDDVDCIYIEMKFLGLLLVYPKLFCKKANCSLIKKNLKNHANEIIFDALLELKRLNTPIDITSVVQLLSSNDELDNIGGVNYLLDIADLVNTDEDAIRIIESYMDMIRNNGTQ